jgi:hypothetical protein
MITKTEAMSKLAKEDEAAYRAIEARIDAALVKHDQRTFVACDVNNRVRDKIIADYTAAGWTVQYGDDQRDGAYLRFM